MPEIVGSARLLFAAAWVIWALSWTIAARWSAPAVARPASRLVVIYRVTSGIGAALIASQIAPPFRTAALWPIPPVLGVILALATVPGFLFAWWARLHLGRLWSAAVTRKAGHRIVESGPYAWVRHPIYTGLLEAALVSAVAGATAVSVAGFALLAAGFWVKAHLEESFLGAELGIDDYRDYRRRVPMLVPWRF